MIPKELGGMTCDFDFWRKHLIQLPTFKNYS